MTTPLQTMVLTSGKWIGAPTGVDHSGTFNPFIPSAVGIAKGFPHFMYCQASSFKAGDAQRALLGGLATYSPNIEGEFSLHCQPVSDADGGGVAYGDGTLDADGSDIWASVGAQSDSGDTSVMAWPPAAHCERLAFIPKCSREGYGSVTGWFGPHSAADGSNCPPPLDINSSLWSRPAGQNICDGMRRRIIVGGGAPATDLFPVHAQGDVDTRAIAGTDQEFQTKKTAVEAGQQALGITNPYLDSEVWGGWTPSTIGRDGDTSVGMGEEFYFHGSDFINGVETPESLAGDYDVHAGAGEWDWRFFCVVGRRIKRTSYTPPRDVQTGPFEHYKKVSTRYVILYWDIGIEKPDPIGVGDSLGAFIADQLCHRAEAGELLPLHTAFDIKIQADVYSFKCNPAMLYAMNYTASPEVLWGKGDPPPHYYVWSHTNFRIKWRQAMPFPS